MTKESSGRSEGEEEVGLTLTTDQLLDATPGNRETEERM